MTVKVVPLSSINRVLTFDVILESNHVVTMTLDHYEIKAYRSASIAEVIEQKILDWLAQNDYNVDELSIIYL